MNSVENACETCGQGEDTSAETASNIFEKFLEGPCQRVGVELKEFLYKATDKAGTCISN